MHSMITKIGIITASASVPIGTLAGANLFAQGTITEQTLMPLGIVVVCTASVVVGTWKAATEFIKITRGLKDLQKVAEEFKSDLGGQKKTLGDIERRVVHIEESCPEVNGNGGKHKCGK